MIAKIENNMRTTEMKLNQYIKEHGRLQQHNQELQRRVSETGKKKDEFITKISSLQETLKDIQQSNVKCQTDLTQLSKIVEGHFESFTENCHKINESTRPDHDATISFLSNNHIKKRTGKTDFKTYI